MREIAPRYRIGRRGIKSDGSGDREFEESFKRVYGWFRERFEDEVLDLLQGYLIVFNEELPPDKGQINREERIIEMRPSCASGAEIALSHELTHALRKDSPYETPEEVAREEGAAVFVTLVYAMERGGDVAEKIFARLMNYKPYSYTAWNDSHSETFEKEFENFSKNSEVSVRCREVEAHLYLGGLCIYLNLANLYGIERVLRDIPFLITPEDFEERYGAVRLSWAPSCLFDREEFFRYLETLRESAGINKKVLYETTLGKSRFDTPHAKHGKDR